MQTNRRLLSEVKRLYKQQTNKEKIIDNNYLIYQNESNMLKVHAIIKPPNDSAYRHKFIRLDFDIPDDYPHSPPKVTFVNWDAVRIHPNMYENGKCCSTILNTWPSENEAWTSSMGIETVLLAFMSFLDNNPYTFEPGGRDDPSYTDYVLHQSWKTCLLRYLYDNEQPDIFTEYMHSYLLNHVDEVFQDLMQLERYYPFGYYETRCFEIDLFVIDYTTIIYQIEDVYRFLRSKDIVCDVIPLNDISNETFKCDICFDTEIYNLYEENLECKHHFHKECLEAHMKTNGEICPMCRRNITKKRAVQDEFIINPKTKRRIKIGGKTYNKLFEN